VYDIYPFQNLRERVTSFLKVLKDDQLQTTKTISVTLIIRVIELVLTWPATSNDINKHNASKDIQPKNSSLHR